MDSISRVFLFFQFCLWTHTLLWLFWMFHLFWPVCIRKTFCTSFVDTPVSVTSSHSALSERDSANMNPAVTIHRPTSPAFVFYDSPSKPSEECRGRALSLTLQMRAPRSKKRETNTTEDTWLINGQDLSMDFMTPRWHAGWVCLRSHEFHT